MAMIRSTFSALLLVQVGAIHEDAAFFGGFAEMESTFNADAIPDPHRIDHGWQGGDHMVHPFDRRGNIFRLARWFDESPSNGANGATQTHFPAAQFQVGRNRNRDWVHTAEGWVQDYSHSKFTGPGVRIQKQPAWFESDIQQVDKFGRHAAPHPSKDHDGELGLAWEDITGETILACESNGCEATSVLSIPAGAKDCTLSGSFFPTGWETSEKNATSRTSWKVNDVSLNTACEMQRSPLYETSAFNEDMSQNETKNCGSDMVERNLLQCVKDVDVSQIMANDPNHALNVIVGSIPLSSPCPYGNDFLRAKVFWTCRQPKETTHQVQTVERTNKPQEKAESANAYEQLIWGSTAPEFAGGPPGHKDPDMLGLPEPPPAAIKEKPLTPAEQEEEQQPRSLRGTK